jgi:undecaprenyl-phosphate galactose phosphotransferase
MRLPQVVQRHFTPTHFWQLERGQARLERPLYATAKRAFDIAFALILLILTLPVLLLAALLVRLTSPGPVIFSQIRCGKDGKPFRCYKFRTMLDGAERLLQDDEKLQAAFIQAWKLNDDPRVTRLGRLLRKTSIDELPQILNVLRGEMSMVGPRPVQPVELEQHFGSEGCSVTSVKPGISGLWAVSGRSSRSYGERIMLELEYIRRRGFAYDLWLVLRTILAVFTFRGAV